LRNDLSKLTRVILAGTLTYQPFSRPRSPEFVGTYSDAAARVKASIGVDDRATRAGRAAR
jgi:hypothetical protein